MTQIFDDLVAQVFGTTQPFVPEQADLGSYAFVPWVRNGLATAITGGPQNNRPMVTASFALTATPPVATPPLPEKKQPISKLLPLRGPGDVIGIDAAQIIRRFPNPNTTLDDDSSLAIVEFDRPDLPWLHSPSLPDGQGRLMPWITLVVCDARVSRIDQGTGGYPARLTTQLGELQPLDGAWAWAHAQALGTVAGGPSIATRLGDGMAQQNLSRLICPRRLSDHSGYYACIVPTFDCGVKAGLHQSGGTLAPAWTKGGDPAGEVVLPVYDFWSFAIGTGYDFEALARRIVPVPAPWQIGRRIIDMRAPRGGLADDLAGQGGLQRLDCAVFSPATPPASVPQPADWPAARAETLRALVAPDRTDALLPRVGPRLYARFQRGRTTLPKVAAPVTMQSDWFGALNLRPADRLVAGLGTRVIQRDQDKLMQAAWAQVGAVNKANAELDRIRLARYVAEALVNKTLAHLPLGTLTAVTRPVHGKIPLPNSPRTVWGEIQVSALPQAAAGNAFRRALVAGPVARAALKGVALARRQQLGALVGPSAAFRDMRRVYADPLAVTGINQQLVDLLPADRLGVALKVPAANARSEMIRRFGAMTPTAAKLAQPRAGWRVAADSGPGLAQQIAGERLARLTASLSGPIGATASGKEAIGAQLAMLAATAPDIAARADATLATLDRTIGPSDKVAVTTVRGGTIGATVGRTIGTTVGRTIDTGPVLTRGGAFTPVGPARGPVTPAAPATPVATAIVARDRFAGFFNAGAFAGTATTQPAATAGKAALANGLASIMTGLGIRGMIKTPPLAAPAISADLLLKALNPGVNAKRGLLARLGALPKWLPGDWFDDLQAKPIMAAPRFDRPMYEALYDYDREWLIPNLGLIDKPDFATLLFTNPRFVEAFLIGLSDEMGRELLWRDYPTDQRGTYFHRFWSEWSDDIGEIARFGAGKLGDHVAGGASPRVVMLLRGAVIKRHPEAMFVAVHGQKQADGKMAFSSPPGSGKGAILFHAALAADTVLVGFDLTEADIAAGDWWFLLAEHPTAPRFGLDVSDDKVAATNVNNLEWADMPMTPDKRFLAPGVPGPNVADDAGGHFAWNSDAATTARMLLQNPARAAFEAKKLMQGIK